MKIKTWLLITFFIVMVLPITGAYSLYVWINAYYQDKNVGEYFEKLTELNQVKSALENPLYYTKNADIKEIEALTNDQLSITLYSKSGLRLYSSDPLKLVFDSKDRVFKGLYELKQNYNLLIKNLFIKMENCLGFMRFN